MKHIKKFESYNEISDNVKVGDYVFLNMKPPNYNNFPHHFKCAVDYINTHVGKLIVYDSRISPKIRVEFENIPTDIQSYFGKTDKKNIFYRTMDVYNIIGFGKTPEEAQFNMITKKYNL